MILADRPTLSQKFTIDKLLKWARVNARVVSSPDSEEGRGRTFVCCDGREKNEKGKPKQKDERREERKSISVLFAVGGGAEIFGIIFKLGAIKKKRPKNETMS